MKKIFIFLLLLLNLLSIRATGFLHENKSWSLFFNNYFYQEHHFHMSHEEYYTITDREVVDGKEYYLMHYEIKTIDSNILECDMPAANNSIPFGLEPEYTLLHVREEDGRAFVLAEDYMAFFQERYGRAPDIIPMQANDGMEVLLYDFNLLPGDAYPMPGNVVVKETGDISYKGSTFHYQLLSDSLLIVEDVGCVNSYGGLIGYQSAPIFGAFERYATYLLWMAVDDSSDTIFYYAPAVDEEMLLTLGVREIYENPRTVSTATYNLQGRRLSSHPEKGVYILDGKKYVK